MSTEHGCVYVLLVTYRESLARIEAAMEAHRRFIDRFYATGEFLASGPQQPRSGGVILARCTSLARAEEITADDPFVQQGLTDYQIVAFSPNRGPFAQPLLDPATATQALAGRREVPTRRPTS